VTTFTYDATKSVHKFTGKEHDGESGLDMFGVRYYGSSLGRFMTPDTPFADQHAVSPQSWNLYSYTRNSPLTLVDPDGQAVKAMTQLALERIRSTLPKEVRAQVTADKNGILSRSAVDAIKSDDTNVKALKQVVDSPRMIEVTTGKSVQGGGPKEIVGVPFDYESVASQQAKIKAAGFEPPSGLVPIIYDGYTQNQSLSPSGNTRVTVADGTEGTANEPIAELAAATAHELYVHALREVQGRPHEHELNSDGTYDSNGAVNQESQQVQDHTKELNKE